MMTTEETTPEKTEPEVQPQAVSQEGKLQDQSAMQAVGLVSGVLGSCAIVFGVILYALDPDILPLAIGNWVFGAVAVTTYVATNFRKMTRVVAGRSSAYLALEAVMACGLIAGVGAANYFGAQNKKEWDLTRDGLFSPARTFSGDGPESQEGRQSHRVF